MIDFTHEKRVDTSLTTNPVREQVGPVPVYHIFRRNRTGAADGDGNPLVYALKGMNGYSIVQMYRTMAFKRAREVLEKFITGATADYVMAMPSSYSLSAEVANLVGEVSGVPLIEPTFLRKRTIGEALEAYAAGVPTERGYKIQRLYEQQLDAWGKMKPNQFMSMKVIDTKIRTLFEPLVPSGDMSMLEGKRIILVDDLMSSGASILSVERLMRVEASAITVAAVCLLSGL